MNQSATPHQAGNHAMGTAGKTTAGFLLAVSPALLPLLLWKYGIDLIDSGWVAVLSRDFFERPEMAGQAAPWFLTFWIGGLLASADPFTITPLRIAPAYPLFLSAAATFFTFWRLGYRDWIVPFGIATAGLTSYAIDSYHSLDYNPVSVCFVVCSLSALFLAGHEGKRGTTRALWLYGLAGALFSLAVATRIASITLVVASIFVLWCGQRAAPRCWVSWLAGSVTSVGALAVLTWHTGHLPYVLNDLSEFLTTSLQDKPGALHGSRLLLHVILSSYLESFARAFMLFVGLAFLADRKGRERPVEALIALAGTLSIMWINRYVLITVTPLLFVILLLLRWPLRLSEGAVPIAVAGALVALAFPVGSNVGFKNSAYALWYLIPGVLVIIPKGRDRLIAAVASGVLVVAGTANALFYTYGDRGVRSLDCEIRNRFAQGVMTTCERRSVLEELVSEISKRAGEGREIFVYQNSPMIYVLTGTRPWLPYPWPYLISPERIEGAIRERELASLPALIVRERLNTMNVRWPELPLGPIAGADDYAETYRSFIERHGFRVVFRNTMFEILAK